jgi:formylglycine-generating enzyme required for sulfatase activity
MCYADWGTTDVFDLSGNVKEWTEERSPGVNPLRGGSFNNTAAGISCAYDFVVTDDGFQFNNVGFRCCRSSAPP